MFLFTQKDRKTKRLYLSIESYYDSILYVRTEKYKVTLKNKTKIPEDVTSNELYQSILF